MTNAKKNKLKRTKKNPWYWLMRKANMFDAQSTEPDGWYWLIFIHYILGIDIADIQKKLPDEHPLKSATLPTSGTKLAYQHIINEFTKRAGIPYGTQKKINGIDFSNLIFKNNANFVNFIFPVKVFFTQSEFFKRAIFSNAVFFGDTEFPNVTFFGEAGFDNAVFFRIGDFGMARFPHNADFSGVTFSQIAGFRGSKFSEFTDFSNATISGHATFADAEFKKHTPHFYNAKISPDIIFERDINLWPQLEKYKHIHKQEEINEIYRINQNSYENLAYHMKTLEKYHDEHFFFRQETRCRKRLEKNSFIRYSYWFYEKTSDYGYGVERAFACWFLHIIAGVYVIAWITAWQDIKYDESLSCAIAASFANANPYVFFGFESSSLKTCYEYFEMYIPIRFAIVRVIQTTVGVAFLFLLLLTLRIRFRLK